MGCIVCKRGTNCNEANLQLEEDVVTSSKCLTVQLNSYEVHNRVKESLPCNIKLAIDNRSALKAKTIAYDQYSLANSKGFRTVARPSKNQVLLGPEKKFNVLPSPRTKKLPHFKPIQNQYLKQCNPLDLNISVTPEIMENPVLFDSGCLVVEKKGSIYNEYKIVDVIGRGSFGVVKKVIHRTSGKPYALKIIKKSCCQNKNFMNEIEILKKLVGVESNTLGSSKYSKFV